MFQQDTYSLVEKCLADSKIQGCKLSLTSNPIRECFQRYNQSLQRLRTGRYMCLVDMEWDKLSPLDSIHPGHMGYTRLQEQWIQSKCRRGTEFAPTFLCRQSDQHSCDLVGTHALRCLWFLGCDMTLRLGKADSLPSRHFHLCSDTWQSDMGTELRIVYLLDSSDPLDR